jgi:hypothetical protein
MSQAAFALAGFRAMVASDLQGGSASYAGADYPCTVGTFDIQQTLTPGGFTPMLLGDIQVAASDLPPATEFKAGQAVTVTPTTGPARSCKVHSVKSLGAILSVTLRDINQGA